ncbi:tRNA/rRNA methyltransferase [Variovorax sp. OK605]|uniref:RNA methyltransferase n=1 Tax=Variovorax sp. OK605 TaxID=1855317 RepID=UPI0008ECD969|nr:RNA methyltransferase [Variovorax sp. OK605]SFP30071.1 tRNA/rRNA methyltransferase [Variovorax sp. OK605]
MRTRFILIQTSHAGNVGAAARAMKTMGFTDLVLVAPRWANVLRREETIQRASGALDVLANARIVETLEEALDGVTHLCATAMIPRDFGPPTRTPREHLEPLGQQADQHVAFLFGSERFGMRNEDVYRCNVALTIPTDPQFGSLNLGAAIQVVAYEWRLALGGYGVREATAPVQAADAQAVAGMLEHWERSLVDIGFLDPAAPKKLMPRLQQLFNRAQPTPEEIHILRGIAKAMSDATKLPRDTIKPPRDAVKPLVGGGAAPGPEAKTPSPVRDDSGL